MMTVIPHEHAVIRIDERDGVRAIVVEPDAETFTPIRAWHTTYPVELIEHVLRVKGPGHLCDEIMRDEDPRYVEHHFRWDLLSYVEPASLAGHRVLDFGAGSGASSLVLARMFPEARIVGVELVPAFVELAERRARFRGVEDRVEFRLSPDPTRLPADIGVFDYVVFSAVFEHLLPEERATVLPLLWAHLAPGGILFLDQTPYRWFPIELHTTGLPFVNYLPDRLALLCARRLCLRFGPATTWPELLRRGIRGGTVREILAILARAPGRAVLLEPTRNGVRDRIDLWYHLSSGVRGARLKRGMERAFRAIRHVTGAEVVPTLSLAIRKDA